MTLASMRGAPFVEVAPARPVHGTFTYRVPESLRGQLVPGVRVVVPFGRRPETGFVVGLSDHPPESVAVERIKDVRDVLDPEPLVPPSLLELLEWAAGYYMAPLGEVIRAALPAGIGTKARRVVWRTESSAATDSQGLGEIGMSLLQRLPYAPPGMECRALLKEVGGASRMHHLVDLSTRGLCELDYVFGKPRVGRRLEARYRRTHAIPGPSLRLTAKRKAVMEVVAAADEPGTSRAAVAAEVPDPAAQLRWLVEQGLLERFEEEVFRDPFAGRPAERDTAPPWSSEQKVALDSIEEALAAGGYQARLVHGVTGSGKTEVYLEAIRRVVDAGRHALVLVPEIALTPQLAGRFRARFGDQVAVLHSGLTDGERYDQWRQIRDGQLPIAVGARSAVFAPFERLGIVVVDEEHDSSYKQDETPRYNARDLALVRAQLSGAVALLGSATPSLESWVNAETGKLARLSLRSRPTGGALPEVEIVDQRRAANGPGDSPLSPLLTSALQETVDAGEQAILFLNRRGWSSFIVCRACGRTFRCAHCSVGLTHHRSHGALRCHYCDYFERVPKACPDCGDPEVGLFGVGTEQLEALVRELLPDARVARLDRDTAGRKGVQTIVDGMRNRTLDVLVGTQMVTKGHDFPGVTLVGVVSADLGLSLPDFRAAERTFQLLTQVAGRAGRGGRPGRVLIQTFNPEHDALRTAREHDYLAFTECELAIRRELGYPPYGHLVAFKLDGTDKERVRRAAHALGRACTAALALPGAPSVAVLGPAAAPLSLLRGRHRWQLLIKGRQRAAVRSLARRALDDARSGISGTRVAIDIDPIHML